jgi:hypothetical protein
MYTHRLKLACLIVFCAVFPPSCLTRAHSDGIVTLYTTASDSDAADDRLASLADFVAWKLGSSTLKEVALYETHSYDVSAGRYQEKVDGYAVWASFFDVLGIRPILGRVFLPEEKQPSQSNVVILSYQLWQKGFDGDPAVLGKTISLGDEKRTVVGIMPKSMDALGPGRILTPFVPGFVEGDAHDRGFHVIAAIKPGATLAQVQTDLDLLDQKRHRDEPKYTSAWKARVVPMKQL